MTEGEQRPQETAASGSKSPASAMLEDWISIWESELAALAMDREMQEAWRNTVSQWASRTRQAAAWIDAFDGSQARSARPRTEARTEAAAAAPDPRDATIAQLARIVEELERRLLEHEDAAPTAGSAIS